jgi:hypothetical protein
MVSYRQRMSRWDGALVNELRYAPARVNGPKTWDEAAKHVRRALAPFSARSIADVALNTLDAGQNEDVERELQSAPWITLLIVKLALESRDIQMDRGLLCDQLVFDQLRNMLWQLSAFDDPDGPPGLFLMLRSMIHTQLLFQRPISFSFIRWPALIDTLPPDHPTRVQFGDVLGMDPDTWAEMAFATLTGAMQGKTYISPAWFSTMQRAYGDSIDVFVDSLARDLGSLRVALRDDFDARMYEQRDGKRFARKNAIARPKAEFYEFPWFARFPLLRHHSGNFAVWHKLVFARGIEQGVHNKLAALGQQYTDPFSKVFEDHVVDLARWSGLPIVDEAQYKAAGNRALKAVDAIFCLNSANVFVESKMSLFHEQVVASDRSAEVFMKLKRVREAIVQGWQVGELLRDGSVNLPQCASATEDFLLIVTSRQLNLGSGEHLKRMFGDNVFDGITPESGARFGTPTTEQLERLPPRNIFILDIEEFDRLCGALQAGEVDLLEVLRVGARDCADPASAKMHFEQILSSFCKRWHVSPLMKQARERMEENLKRALLAVDQN